MLMMLLPCLPFLVFPAPLPLPCGVLLRGATAPKRRGEGESGATREKVLLASGGECSGNSMGVGWPRRLHKAASGRGTAPSRPALLLLLGLLLLLLLLLLVLLLLLLLLGLLCIFSAPLLRGGVACAKGSVCGCRGGDGYLFDCPGARAANGVMAAKKRWLLLLLQPVLLVLLRPPPPLLLLWRLTLLPRSLLPPSTLPTLAPLLATPPPLIPPPLCSRPRWRTRGLISSSSPVVTGQEPAVPVPV
jgi:hypothetical protein